MIRIENVSKWFGPNRVLSEVSFSLEETELVGLVGPSGSGKSVLLKVMGDVLEPDSGRLAFDEEDREHKVGFLFQEGALFDSMSVLENVAFPLRSARNGISDKEAYASAFEMLDSVGLAAAYKKVPGQLSGGMRRRVGIARALVGKPELVLLDDPTGGLDPVAASVIMTLIRKLHSQYKPVIVLVSHDIRRLLPSVERVLGLFAGELVCDEPPQSLEANAPKDVLSFLKTRFDFSLLEAAA